MMPLIIFDTATRLLYCEDVHEMLAAPPGGIVNYDYRERWVDPSSLAFLKVGAPVILVYCELPGFGRSVDPAFYWGATTVPLSEATFATTRAGVVESVRLQGGTYHIAIRLGGYTAAPEFLLQSLVASLPSMPGAHFVVRGDSSWDSIWLVQSPDRSQWAKVVDALQQPRLQFRRDIFWRVEAVIDKNSGRALVADKQGLFHVRTGRSVLILLASHTGKVAAGDLAWDMRRVKVESTTNSPLLMLKSQAEIGMRRTGESRVEISFPVTAEWRRSVETLSIRTEVEGALGSAVTLAFSISHHPARVGFATLLACIAAVASLVAAGLMKNGSIGKAALLALVAFVAGYFATRLMPLK